MKLRRARLDATTRIIGRERVLVEIRVCSAAVSYRYERDISVGILNGLKCRGREKKVQSQNSPNRIARNFFPLFLIDARNIYTISLKRRGGKLFFFLGIRDDESDGKTLDGN